MLARLFVLVVVLTAASCATKPADTVSTRPQQTVASHSPEYLVIDLVRFAAHRDESDPARPVISISHVGSIRRGGRREDRGARDHHLKQLAVFKDLRSLDLSQSEVTDAGLKELAALTGLRTLRIEHTKVTNAGLKELAPLTELRKLSINANIAWGVGVEGLAALKGLRILELGGEARVKDPSLKGFGALQGLRHLNLWQTGVTDAGLKELANLKGLRTLVLADTKVTDEGVARLQRALPKCGILRAWPVVDPKLLIGE
jgi:hypothetical protein